MNKTGTRPGYTACPRRCSASGGDARRDAEACGPADLYSPLSGGSTRDSSGAGAVAWSAYVVVLYVYPAIFVMVYGALLAAVLKVGAVPILDGVSSFIRDHGAGLAGAELFLLITVVSALAPPGLASPLYCMSGYALGALPGTVVNWGATALGSFLCFLTVRSTVGPALKDELVCVLRRKRPSLARKLEIFSDMLEGRTEEGDVRDSLHFWKDGGCRLILLTRFADLPFLLKNCVPGLVGFHPRRFAIALVLGSWFYQGIDAIVGEQVGSMIEASRYPGGGGTTVEYAVEIAATAAVGGLAYFEWERRVKEVTEGGSPSLALATEEVLPALESPKKIGSHAAGSVSSCSPG
jgi:uncharacterized membrane protein YdjX (TVP38/TMEM64 family)